ncbi:translation elongation factor Ts [Wohlfahrtiimonas chitiniclastica]|uniref:Elongation factor Ts n=2 Tax=Wohlfahrtiimonas chitiniclastica TaxID=400946 RepID=L8XVA8_9GAMM|nr:translation elongation factor Ts [Wohlfahrtiimonas chitiniclastica]ELV07842.1 Elongation factor Ts [Wohlfahrtiimonas chitiniclastica SH04]KZS23468.1 elongation factor Ts [Wohlfahrtiimonas chitiniclastica]KZX36925.1 elongation factor Ts [Wohlfahrtiimonas chitiniclastica]MBS7815373.1 elongation factor Ts [Wohlfahrtiimonas chitiniclastica]MBS7817449.1 elongation factor Ts [Wohlfahrtiimonas chitiniclastica]
MANITAAMVKELRERTGSAMMDCKKALTETNGDMEAAIDLMRKNGLAKADKKSDRAAAEGLLLVRQNGTKALILEVNCETDFVTKNEDFLKFANDAADIALNNDVNTVEELAAQPLNGSTVDEVRKGLIAKIGENMNVRRLTVLNATGTIGGYVHGGRIAAIVEVQGGDEELAKDVAMHIAAANPVCIDASEVPAELLEKEREIYSAQAAESGKPADIVEKMVEGRIRKYLEEVTLEGQAFIKDPDMSVGKLLKSKSAKVTAFVRFELGEGVEIETIDFATEVMAQAGLNK